MLDRFAQLAVSLLLLKQSMNLGDTAKQTDTQLVLTDLCQKANFWKYEKNQLLHNNRGAAVVIRIQ